MSITYLELVLILSTLSVYPRSLHSKRLPLFPFPPSTPPMSPGSDTNWKWTILDMTSFYISSFIKIWSPINEITYLNFHNLSLPTASPRWVESGKQLLSRQFLQVPNTPINFHRPSSSRSTEIGKAYPWNTIEEYSHLYTCTNRDTQKKTVLDINGFTLKQK